MPCPTTQRPGSPLTDDTNVMPPPAFCTATRHELARDPATSSSCSPPATHPHGRVPPTCFVNGQVQVLPPRMFPSYCTSWWGDKASNMGNSTYSDNFWGVIQVPGGVHFCNYLIFASRRSVVGNISFLNTKTRLFSPSIDLK